MVLHEASHFTLDIDLKIFLACIVMAMVVSKSLVIFTLVALSSVALAEIAELSTGHRGVEKGNVGFKVFTLMVKWWKRDEKMKGKKRRQVWRQNRLSRLKNIRCMRVCLLVSLMGSVHRMETQQLLEQIGRLTEAATQAANAAGVAAGRIAEAKEGRSASSTGLETATKILKAPDTYNGEDPIQFNSWKMRFESWWCFGDDRYTSLLSRIEGQTKEPDTQTYGADQENMARKFFAVLSSYLRGKCLHLVRANQEDNDGFKLRYQLCKEYLPSTRQRSLALAQALSQFPNFNPKVSLLESILQFEQLCTQYEAASKQTYPSDLKSATLIRCAPTKLKEHLQLSLTDRSSYADVREAILAYERVSKSFTQGQILKNLEIQDKQDGPTPMEVDRVYDKGKGKGKKSKGKGWWSNTWSFGRGRG